MVPKIRHSGLNEPTVEIIGPNFEGHDKDDGEYDTALKHTFPPSPPSRIHQLFYEKILKFLTHQQVISNSSLTNLTSH